MLELIFTAADVARTRIAISPLWEIVASVLVLQTPSPPALYEPWVTDARKRLAKAELDIRLLSELVSRRTSYVPDFLSPSPQLPSPDLSAMLASVRATPSDHVRKDLDRMMLPRSAAVDALYRDPVRGLEQLTGIMQAYWDVTLAPHWERMRRLLEGEVLYRSRRLADGGAQYLFEDLNPRVRWKRDTLSIAHNCVSGRYALAGRALVLTPSIFAWPAVYSILWLPWQPTLLYPARGLFSLWEDRPRQKTPDGLVRVIGRSRASLLAELELPRSTTELAQRTGLSAGGVSQHLAALQAAGFVDTRRSGRAVLYERTDLGNALLH